MTGADAEIADVVDGLPADAAIENDPLERRSRSDFTLRSSVRNIFVETTILSDPSFRTRSRTSRDDEPLLRRTAPSAIELSVADDGY
jgi:hypothetical protein